MRIGVDVGGTFTDVVLVNDAAKTFYFTKASTSPPDLWNGVLAGIDKILALAETTIDQVQYIVHGTTIGTNALIERKGARTGLITTAGFADVLEIGRFQRPDTAMYNFFIDNPEPLVPRYLRRGVPERVDARGRVVKALDEDAVRRAVADLKSEGVEAIAVSLLFSFMNPAHEQRILEIIGEEFPAAHVSLSSVIAPEFREYERTSTTVINAYLQPVMQRYLQRLSQELRQKYGNVDLRIMQASGGSFTPEAAERMAITTVNSGPAGGSLAAAFIGELTGHNRLIAVDMGGTSFDISLSLGGKPAVSSEAKFEELPVRIPVIHIDTIGAGGGSIAWTDRGGVLNVGPESAGARPGPACYGRGGTRPTVTDANLVLGRLAPDAFLGGEMSLDADRAVKAIADVAGELGMDVAEAAAGIIRVVNAKMAKQIRVNSVEKGHDPREFAMIAFGGAGALHAVELARELEIKTVIVPELAGNLSAFGLLVADARHDHVQTYVAPVAAADAAAITAVYRQLAAAGRAQLQRERFADSAIELQWSADLRYEGQGYEMNIPVPARDLGQADLDDLVRLFHDTHRQRFAYASEEETVQFVNLRVAAIGQNPPVVMQASPLVSGDGSGALIGRRAVTFVPDGRLEAPVYQREKLQPGEVISGPALVQERLSATVLPPGCKAHIDGFGNLIVEVGGV